MTLSSGGFGGLVRRRRERLGLSLREAARRIGISPSYLVAIERGRNPSTGRAPVPSPPVLAAIGRELDLELAALLDAAGAATSPSVHVLLYQAGPGHRSPLDALRRLFADRVDSWIEIADPRLPADAEPPPDVLVRRRRAGETPGTWETDRVLDGLSDLLAEVPRTATSPRLGLVFGSSSALLRSVENPSAVLESEETWEDDVRAAVGAEPAANVCVYREADIQELSSRLDPLATVLSLVETHPHVVVDDGSGALLTGAAAIETILAAARPAGVSSGTWQALARAAAAGLAREAAVGHPLPRLEEP
jgi:transcriptional regulator with XRE-family HTH domain